MKQYKLVPTAELPVYVLVEGDAKESVAWEEEEVTRAVAFQLPPDAIKALVDVQRAQERAGMHCTPDNTLRDALLYFADLIRTARMRKGRGGRY